MNQNGRRNLYILSFTLFVVMLGFGLVIPIIPFYMESMGAGGTEMGLLVTVYATMRLIFGPLWGALSDRIGRKPVLMIGVLGYGITMLFFWICHTVVDDVSGPRAIRSAFFGNFTHHNGIYR